MTLELLSSIKDAKESSAVSELFRTIKKASALTDQQEQGDDSYSNEKHMLVEELRDDRVIESSRVEKDIIKGNFPASKDGLLVVSKVIDEI